MSELEELQKNFEKKIQELERHLAELDKWRGSVRQWRMHAQAYIQDLDLKKMQIEALILKLDSIAPLDVAVGVEKAEQTAVGEMHEHGAPAPRRRGGGRRGGGLNPKRKEKAEKTALTVDQALEKVKNLGFEGIDKDYSAKVTGIQNLFKK